MGHWVGTLEWVQIKIWLVLSGEGGVRGNWEPGLAQGQKTILLHFYGFSIDQHRTGSPLKYYDTMHGSA